MPVPIRPATREDVPQLAGVLSRAFRDDPMLRWMFPGDRAWDRWSPRMWALAMRSELDQGTVFTTDDLRGVAVWRDPAKGEPTMAALLRSTFPMIAYLGLRSPLVFRGFQSMMSQHPPEPHWYLTVIGTDPEHQGQGVGTALVNVVLEKCAEQQLPAYLEASRPENVPYYQRHGFEVLGEINLPKGPPVWRMLFRPPA